MAYTKTILCLANSRKYQGRCVGGKVYEAGVFGECVPPWIASDEAQGVHACCEGVLLGLGEFALGWADIAGIKTAQA